MSVTAQTLQFKTIVGWIMSWIQTVSKSMPVVVCSKGGWEGWAQVEIHKFLIEHELPGNPAIHREQPIYNKPKSAVDFRIATRTERICIELKCEGLFESAKQGRVTMEHTFYKEVLDDVIKLKTDRKTEYAKEPAMVIALCFSDEASIPMKSLAEYHEEMPVGDGSWKLHIFWSEVRADW